ARRRFMLIVVAFDDDDGDARLVELPQHEHRVVSGLRVYVAAVEKVAGDDHEVDAAPERVSFDDVAPGAEEVAGAVRQVVALDAEVNVCDVEKSGHALRKRTRSCPHGPFACARSKRSRLDVSLISQPA